MKHYTRIARRRVEAAFKLRVDRTRPEPEPRMDEPLDNIPAEVIRLETGPFVKQFPDLARGRRKR